MAEIIDREATIGGDLIVLAEIWPWKVIVDKQMFREDCYVLKAVQPGVNLPERVKKHDLQDLHTYLKKQRQQADTLRGYLSMRVGLVSEGIR